MTRWFTSDWHLSHENILSLANRPFNSVEEMNQTIIDNYNSLVKPNDIVYVLGDVALGKISESLPLISQFNGYKVLIVGNHDRIFEGNKEKEVLKFRKRYEEQFNVIWVSGGALTTGGTNVLLSHFPYTSDSHGEDRYQEFRYRDNGIPIVHGHTHAKNSISYSDKGTKQIHIGVDTWNYQPCPENEIIEMLRN